MCAQTATQTFTLHPGWNSLWLEVQPAGNAVTNVFPPGLPIGSVWTFNPKVSPVDFIQSQTEDLWNVPGWLNYFPPSRPESFLNSLFFVDAQRPYLVKLDGTTNVALTVSGRPVVRTPVWVPDRYNLKGFPVDPAAAPTFKAFFQYSPAHFDAALNRLRGVYRLGVGGQWTPVNQDDTMQPGEAYWVFTQAASTYAGPLSVKPEVGDNLDFDAFAQELNVTLQNNTTAPRSLTIQSASAAGPLVYATLTTDQGLVWLPLPSPLVVNLAGNDQTQLRLGIQRGAFSGDTFESTLEIKNGAGISQRLGVTAKKANGSGVAARGIQKAAGDGDDPLAGLWVGTVALDHVNEVNSVNPANLTPTKSPFNLRLIVHVDKSGRARLLREVIQLMQSGTFTNDASGIPVRDQPPRNVLVTEDRLTSQFSPLAIRDGQLVGRRLSSAAFDFAGSSSNVLALTGAFGGTNTLAGTISAGPNFPTNPFRDKYHPDHDNLDATFQNPKTEAYPITRNFELNFRSSGPPGALDYGYSTVGGVYRETITGLHKRDIIVRGNFTLSRASSTGVLNQ